MRILSFSTFLAANNNRGTLLDLGLSVKLSSIVLFICRARVPNCCKKSSEVFLVIDFVFRGLLREVFFLHVSMTDETQSCQLRVFILCSLSHTHNTYCNCNRSTTTQVEASILLHTTPHSNHFKHEAAQRLLYHINDASRVGTLPLQRKNWRSQSVG